MIIDYKLISRLRSLIPGAKDLGDMTEWPDALIEDYLSLFENIVFLATTLNTLITELKPISFVSAENLSGIESEVDTTENDGGNVVFYFYIAISGSNVRAGFLYCPWESTDIPTRPGAQDKGVGDTSDMYFSFTSDGSEVSLLMTSTNTYDFKAIKILL